MSKVSTFLILALFALIFAVNGGYIEIPDFMPNSESNKSAPPAADLFLYAVE
jgi:hypothetical protein